MKKKAIIFGAGKIARGFIGQLLYLSDFEITFVDVFEPIVNAVSYTHLDVYKRQAQSYGFYRFS